jgi:hypothetical protein
MQKEAREMKAMEAQLKWSMKRDEDKMRKDITKQDARDLATWRREREESIAEYAKKRQREDKVTQLDESREYQEFKRSVQAEVKEVEIQEHKIDYEETRATSEWEVDLKRTVPLEEERVRIEANLAKYHDLGTYKLQKDRQEKLEENFARDLEENTVMNLQLQQAKEERDEALKSLDYFRTQQNRSIPTENDIASRPFLPLDQTL